MNGHGFFIHEMFRLSGMLNKALCSFEKLPIVIYTEKDPDWNEYHEMYELRQEEGSDDVLADE